MINSMQSKNPSLIPLEADLHPDVPLSDLTIAHTGTTSKGKETDGTSKVEKPPPSVPDYSNITPDALMAYCQSRLQSLDTQMTDIFASQQKNSSTTEALNNVAGALNDLPLSSSQSGSSSTTSAVDLNDKEAITDDYTAAIAAAGGKNTPLGASLTKDLNSFEAAASNGTISSDTLSGLSQNLKDDTSNLNSDSEMTMINLQSLMTQRQTAVQLTTNLMQSLGEQSGDIAKNIGQ